MKKFTRRELFKISGIGLATLPFVKITSVFANKQMIDSAKIKYPVFGLASFSTREFTLDQTIEMCKRLGLTKLALKDIHLPLNSTNEYIGEVLSKIHAAGINFFGAGVIYMKSKEEVNKAFDYALKAELTEIIGVPGIELLPYVESKAKEFNINVAIHNHGPNDKLYPGPKDIYDKIKNMDKHIGICLDIGHTQRNGEDPADALKNYFDRIMDIHLKDETSADINGQTIEIGRGVIDIPKFIKAIIDLKYSGNITFEFEKDPKDPLPGLAESIGFVKGVLANMQD